MVVCLKKLKAVSLKQMWKQVRLSDVDSSMLLKLVLLHVHWLDIGYTAVVSVVIWWTMPVTYGRGHLFLTVLGISSIMAVLLDVCVRNKASECVV